MMHGAYNVKQTQSSILVCYAVSAAKYLQKFRKSIMSIYSESIGLLEIPSMQPHKRIKTFLVLSRT